MGVSYLRFYVHRAGSRKEPMDDKAAGAPLLLPGGWGRNFNCAMSFVVRSPGALGAQLAREGEEA